MRMSHLVKRLLPSLLSPRASSSPPQLLLLLVSGGSDWDARRGIGHVHSVIWERWINENNTIKRDTYKKHDGETSPTTRCIFQTLNSSPYISAPPTGDLPGMYGCAILEELDYLFQLTGLQAPFHAARTLAKSKAEYQERKPHRKNTKTWHRQALAGEWICTQIHRGYP